MDFNDLSSLTSNGFAGFDNVLSLKENYQFIPDEKGIYFVLIPEGFKVSFKNPGSGGFFKGKDPNVDLETLRKNWVDNSRLVYIGKAGSSKNKSTLRSRIKQYLKIRKW